MTSVEEHLKTLKQMEEDIKQKIRENTVLERQKIIGFAVSEGALNCFAIFLHKNNIISEGFNVNHKWFGSEKLAKKHLPSDFTKKEIIIPKLVEIELLRDRLCYGKEKSLKEVERAIKLFFDVKRDISDMIGEEL